MLNCKTITITTCPDDSICDACKEIVKSQCIKYTGDDLASLGINKGDTFNDILIKLNIIITELSGS